jgi:hypothetical protein
LSITQRLVKKTIYGMDTSLNRISHWGDQRSIEGVGKSVGELTVFFTECKILHLRSADFYLRYHEFPFIKKNNCLKI